MLGLGHIGGSLALALPGSVAWSRSAETRAAAAAAGVDVVDSVAEVVAAADIVVVAAALPALEAVVDQVAEAVADLERSPTITDVGSVKAPIAAHAAAVLPGPLCLRAGPPAGRHRAVRLGQRRRLPVRRHHLGAVGGRARRARPLARGGPPPVQPRRRGRAGHQRRARPHPRPHEPPALRPGRALRPPAPTPRPSPSRAGRWPRSPGSSPRRTAPASAVSWRRPTTRRWRPRSTGSSTTSSTPVTSCGGATPPASAPRSCPCRRSSSDPPVARAGPDRRELRRPRPAGRPHPLGGRRRGDGPGARRMSGFTPPPLVWETLGDVRAEAERHPGGAIDLTIGTPTDPPPSAVVAALGDSGQERGYPPSIGSADAPGGRVGLDGPKARRHRASRPGRGDGGFEGAGRRRAPVAAAAPTRARHRALPGDQLPDLRHGRDARVDPLGRGAGHADRHPRPRRDRRRGRRPCAVPLDELAGQPDRRARRPRRGRILGQEPRRARPERRVLRGAHLVRARPHHPRARRGRRARRPLVVQAIEPGGGAVRLLRGRRRPRRVPLPGAQARRVHGPRAGPGGRHGRARATTSTWTSSGPGTGGGWT